MTGLALHAAARSGWRRPPARCYIAGGAPLVMDLHPELVESHAIVDGVLARWAGALGGDAPGYRGHVYRTFNFCRALLGDAADEERIAVAAVHHDLGIWSDGTFDYLAPSAARADAYLAEHARAAAAPEVRAMILWHHRVRSCPEGAGAHAEAFRRADLIDVSLGAVRYGLARSYVDAVRSTFPNAGFHRCLLRIGAAWLMRHPLRPLPMLRW